MGSHFSIFSRKGSQPLFIAAAMSAVLLFSTEGAWAVCQGPGAPANTQTKCLTAVTIPGNPLKSFDISWVNPLRAEYYLADRSNKGIDVIDTGTNTFKGRVGGGTFVGLVGGNNTSGPDGVVTHNRWLYAGDGNSTLKVFDLNGPATTPLQTLSTGGTTRLDEMALTTDGTLLLGANNAEDPPFATLFKANGDNAVSNVSVMTKVFVTAAIIPAGFGLSLEQPAWDPKTQRFYTSIPIIANNPAGCNYGQLTGKITCDGGLLVVDPTTLTNLTATLGAFDQNTNTGVVPLHACGPNGATVGVHDNLLLGCTPGNNPSDTTTLVINAKTKNYANIANITGSDEVYFNAGDKRYYTGSSSNPGGAVLGVIDETSVLIETIPQGTGSHSVAADSRRNEIYVPQNANDVSGVAAGLCGGTNGCVAVYKHGENDGDDEDGDQGGDRD
jgi:hypothetical protein